MSKILILFAMLVSFFITSAKGKQIDRKPADLGPPTNVVYPLEEKADTYYEVNGPNGISYINTKDCTEDYEICEEMEFDIEDGYKPAMVLPWFDTEPDPVPVQAKKK